MSYAPARDRALRTAEATAEQAWHDLECSVMDIQRAEECSRVSMEPKQVLAAKLVRRDLRAEYERLMAVNATAQLRFWSAVRYWEQRELSEQQRELALSAVRKCVRQRAANDLLQSCRSQAKRRHNSERTERPNLCGRRAALVGAAAPVAPPAVMVSNYSGVAQAM